MATRYTRRNFLKNSAMGALAISGLPGRSLGESLDPVPGQEGTQVASSSGELEQGCFHPPDSVHPWIYWYACNSNITREGITADLEAMHRVGIRGVLYMEVDEGVPKGPVRFLTPEWRKMIQYAVEEATRLGITVNMNNGGG